MSGDQAADVASGDEITLASGAKVALFLDVAPGVHAVRFINGEVITRLKLSDGALQALVALATKDGNICWTVA